MPETTTIHVRIDKEIKDQAACTLGSMGLSISDAVRLLMFQVVEERALPFRPHVPNAETAEVLDKSARGEDVYHCGNAGDLFDQLGL